MSETLRPHWAETSEQLRKRIARDLHEDLGARLLTQLHRAADDAAANSSRHMLEDVRALLDTLDPRGYTLEECLNEWRAALQERLGEAPVALRFPDSDQLPDVWLTTLERLNPRRILGEFVDNALTHARPGAITVELQLRLPVLVIRIEHDGHGDAMSGWRAARGLRNQALRAQDLRAELSYEETDNHHAMTLRFALQHADGGANAARIDR